MPCNRPQIAFLVTETGDPKVRVSMSRKLKKHQTLVKVIELPCRKCLGCKMARSREWAIRCQHEAQMHEHNCFITLTYDEKNIPDDRGLQYIDFQLFMKRLRKRFTGTEIKFFMCGEYTPQKGRPHFHACLFGLDFADKKYFRKTKRGSKIYRSRILEELWDKGFSTIGTVNAASAGYVARYLIDKQRETRHYEYIDKETGEVHQREKEFQKMSLRDAIGKRWYEQFKSDVFPHDYIIIDGRKAPVPGYYRQLLRRSDLAEYQKVTDKRIAYIESDKRTAKEKLDERVRREKCLQEKMRELCRAVDPCYS